MLTLQRSRSRAPRRSRAFRPNLLGLEPRQLLDGTAPTFELTENTPVGLPPNVVGGDFSFTVRVTPPNPGAIITKVSWIIVNSSDFSPGAMRIATDPSTGKPYANPLDANGFYEETYRVANTGGGLTSTLTGNWDGTPGNHTVSAYIDWVDSQGKEHSEVQMATAPVQVPDVVITPKPNRPDPKLYKDDRSDTEAAFGVGTDYDVKVANSVTDRSGNPVPIQGSFGVIQTVVVSNVEAYANNPDLLDSWNNPIVVRPYAIRRPGSRIPCSTILLTTLRVSLMAPQRTHTPRSRWIPHCVA
jgi:hypothetical protein